MKKNFECAILTLWLIAILSTLFILRDTGLFIYLAPVYFVCMIGSVLAAKTARKNFRNPNS